MKIWFACVLVLCLGSASAIAQMVEKPKSPLVFETADNQHKAVVVGRIILVANLLLDAKSAWECPHRVRCFVVSGTRLAATVGISEAIKHWFPVDRPCAPSGCGSDSPRSNLPSEDTALATQSLGLFDQAGQCGATRSGKQIAFTVSSAAFVGGFRRAAWRHDMKAVLLGAGIGTGVDFLTARLLCG